MRYFLGDNTKFIIVLFLIVTSVFSAEAKKKQYANGDLYEGEIVNNLPHDLGKMSYANGNVYYGFWKDGIYHGGGIMSYANGSRYDGEWEKGSYNGVGTMTYANGDSYYGDWVFGVRNGLGTITFADGSQFEGAWVNNKRKGEGTLTMANGDKYQGVWENDILIEGQVQYASHKQYKGKMQGEQPNGKGEMIYPNQDSYFGNWKAGKISGWGEMSLTDGHTYIGKWADSLFVSGKHLQNGQLLQEGEWENGRFMSGKQFSQIVTEGGFSVIIEEVDMGEVYETAIKYSDGSQYTGKATQGRRNDRGTYISAPNSNLPLIRIEGLWQDDCFVYGSGLCQSSESYSSEKEVFDIEFTFVYEDEPRELIISKHQVAGFFTPIWSVEIGEMLLSSIEVINELIGEQLAAYFAQREE